MLAGWFSICIEEAFLGEPSANVRLTRLSFAARNEPAQNHREQVTQDLAAAACGSVNSFLVGIDLSFWILHKNPPPHVYILGHVYISTTPMECSQMSICYACVRGVRWWATLATHHHRRIDPSVHWALAKASKEKTSPVRKAFSADIMMCVRACL